MRTPEDYANGIGIPLELIRGKSRKLHVAIARDVYWRYLRQRGVKLTAIAAMFDRKAHSTVHSGIKHAENLISCKDVIATPFQRIIDA